MSRLISFALLLVCAASLAVAQKKQATAGGASNSGILDNFDVDSVLNNGRVLKNYVKCVLEQGPCTAEGREMKSKCDSYLTGRPFLIRISHKRSCIML